MFIKPALFLLVARYIKGVPLLGGRGEEEREQEETAFESESGPSSRSNQPAPGGLSARIVGQGYKQVDRRMHGGIANQQVD